MDFDAILNYISRPCAYTVTCIICLCLMNLSSCVQQLLNNFLAPRLDHWCKEPAFNSTLINSTYQKELSIPYESYGEYEKCLRYDVTWDNYSIGELAEWDWNDHTNTTSVICKDGWNYDRQIFSSTATETWDLVCEKQNIHVFVSPLFIAGLFFGSLIAGPIADNIGRQRTVIIFIIVQLLGGAGVVFSIHEWMFIASRFVVAVGTRVCAITSVVSSMELTPPNYRSAVVSLNRLFYTSGVLVVVLVAYLVRDFRKLQLVVTAPLVLLLIIPVLIPESPRWLMSKGYTKRARKSIQTMAHRARTTIPPDILDIYTSKKVIDETVHQKKKKNSNKELFAHPVLLKWLAICGFSKAACQLVYFAVSMNLDGLFGNIYVNTMLAGVTEIPAVLAFTYLMSKYGRLRLLYATYGLTCIGGILSIIFIIFLPDQPMVNTVTMILIRCVASCAVNVNTLISGELFPSYMRQTALGISSAIASFVAIFSPIIGGPMQEIWEPLPSLVFAIVSAIAMFTIIGLPETMGKRMPETIQESMDLMNKHPDNDNAKPVDTTLKQSDSIELGLKYPKVCPDYVAVISGYQDNLAFTSKL